MKIATVFLLLLPDLMLAQQRYLISPSQEVIPLTKQQSAAIAIRQRLLKSSRAATNVSAACSNKFTFGYTEDRFSPTQRIGALPRGILGQWYVAKATGTIDTIFWDVPVGASVGAKDSVVYVRIHNSLIGPNYGPGIRNGLGDFDPPCQNWGYWSDNLDSWGGIAAFPDDANPVGTPFHSTLAHGTAGPPFGSEIWGLGGYPATDHVGAINHVAMLDNGFPCSVSVGQVFLINMRVNSPNIHLPDEPTTEWAVSGFRVSAQDENYPSRDWTFYEFDSVTRCFGMPAGTARRGWVARGGFLSDDSLDVAAYNWWYTMTVQSNTPPQVSDIEGGRNTLSTGPRLVTATIVDCDPASPGNAGVMDAWIYWSLNDIPQPRVGMVPTIGDTWQGTIPGEPAGSLVTFVVKAIDADSASGEGPPETYRVVGLENTYYVIDTFSTCAHTSIAATGTPIDTSAFFNEVPAMNPKDDGTAGPFRIPGGPMTIFGDTARYVWIGTNGAIALSKHATDTLDLTSEGTYTGGWTFPMRERHGRPDLYGRALPPGNMIAPFYADFILGDSGGQYGHIRYGDGGDPCQFIVEWDSLATFDASGLVRDNTTFRVILDRCDGSIRYEYDIVGSHGPEYHTLTGLQADSNSVTAGYPGAVPGYVFLSQDGYPVETTPAAGRCIVVTPGAAIYAKAGWNLLSISRIPRSFAKADVFPGASSPAFYFHGGTYLMAETLKLGQGYWLKYARPTYAGVVGSRLNAVYDSVYSGWNMIGTPSTPVTPASVIPSGGISTTSSYFGYNGSGYVIIGTISNPALNPGNGYWIRVSGNGTLQLIGSTNLPKESPIAGELASASAISFRNARGNSQTLYLGSDAAIGDPSFYEMPPSMADLSGFDARFASGRAVEAFPTDPASGASFEYPVIVQSESYPLTIFWKRGTGTPSALNIVVRDDHGKLLGVLDGPSSTVRIANSSVKTIVLGLGGGPTTPKEFALSENYPNPFNPSTHFTVDVPRTANVDVVVYDVLGRKVASLLTGVQPAGRMTVTWDGRDGNGLTAPSGAYFVRMKAGEFTAVRKIIMMK